MSNKITSQRLEFLDIMKGFTIFLVVLGHALGEVSSKNPLNIWIYAFHMPFFFMLSGFLSLKTVKSGKGYLINIKNKFISLMIPFIICGICYSLSSDLLPDFIWSVHHAGYWFLFSLFTMWIIFLSIHLLLNVLHLQRYIVIEAICLICPFFIGNIIMTHLSPNIVNALSLPYTIADYRFFILGYYLGRFWSQYHQKECLFCKFLDGHITQACSIIIFLGLGFYLMHGNDGRFMTIKQVLLCISLFIFLYNYKSFLNQIAANILAFCGYNSLIIYVFHYLFICQFSYKPIEELPIGAQTIIAIIITIIVIIASLIIANPFRNNKILAFLFLGQRK